MRALIVAMVCCLVVGGCISIVRRVAPDSAAAATEQLPLQPSPTLTAPTATPPPLETAGPTDQPTAPPTESPAVQPTLEPSASPEPTAGPETLAPPTPTRPPVDSTSVACNDDSFKRGGFHWNDTLRWRFVESSVPSGLDAQAVLSVLETSFANITEARNDCGRPDNVGATAEYLSTTDKPPCAGDFGDSINSVGFGELPRGFGADTLAVMCPWVFNDIAIETDILINEDVPWALSLAECFGFEEMLEATITHEVGHAFGLGHVSERRHGDLTMSTRSNGSCNNEEASLGLGDLLGLEALYPPD